MYARPPYMCSWHVVLVLQQEGGHFRSDFKSFQLALIFLRGKVSTAALFVRARPTRAKNRPCALGFGLKIGLATVARKSVKYT